MHSSRKQKIHYLTTCTCKSKLNAAYNHSGSLTRKKSSLVALSLACDKKHLLNFIHARKIDYNSFEPKYLTCKTPHEGLFLCNSRFGILIHGQHFYYKKSSDVYNITGLLPCQHLMRYVMTSSHDIIHKTIMLCN